jgi:hypothetical protein
MKQLAISLCLLGALTLHLGAQSTAPPPTITTASPLPDGTTSNPYSYFMNASGGTTPYTWSVATGALPPGLSISPSTGQISGTPTAPGTYGFAIRCTGFNGAFDQDPFQITVRTAVVISTPSPAPFGVSGVPYQNGTFQFSATGGTPPYNWALSNGNLPLGLNLSSSGALTGIPTLANLYSFELRVVDSSEGIAGQGATKQFTLRIVNPLLITTATPVAAAVGSELALPFQATGGLGPYFFSSNNLPQGFHFDVDSSGTLRGTPTATGDFPFTVQALDALQQTATKAFTLSVKPAVTITSASPLTTGFVGGAYSFTFAAAGGNPPYAWTIDAGPVPGLTLAASTGALNGTPQAPGDYTITVRATDTARAFATKRFNLRIDASPTSAPILSTSSLEFLAG